MPILDSFLVDHTKIKSPSLREAKIIKTPLGDYITIFDFRFYTPNTEIMPEKGIHTLEHLFSHFMRNYFNKDKNFCFRQIVDISPMGCRTGFYMVVIGNFVYEDYKIIIKYWKNSMLDVLKFDDNIFGANIYQCGSYVFHSLIEAKEIAVKILDKKIIVLNNNDLFLNENLIK